MRILIIDDDAGLRRPLSILLEEAGHSVAAEEDAENGLVRARAEDFHVILCDVHLPGIDGLAFLRRYRGMGGTALLIMMSAFGTEEEAFAAMREGAYDYIRKPFVVDEVLLTLRKAEERERLRREVETLRASMRDRGGDPHFIGDSPAMRQVIELVSRAAGRSEPVLVLGENGTGKEFAARAIHRLSDRSAGGFVAVGCAAIPAPLLAVELFGESHGRLSQSAIPRSLLAAAEGGTLFLDQVHALSADLQLRLLEVIEGSAAGRGPDIRWMAAASAPLEWAVERGAFHPDLLARLDAIHIDLPPLRDRREDISSLIAHFAQRAAHRGGRSVSVTPAALQLLVSHEWPGNVRGLRQAIERAAGLSDTGRLDCEDFQLDITPVRPPRTSGAEALALKPQLEALEREVITRALTATRGNRREASKLLRVSLRTLFYKLRRYGLEV